VEWAWQLGSFWDSFPSWQFCLGP